jgi:hypothetical protein
MNQKEEKGTPPVSPAAGPAQTEIRRPAGAGTSHAAPRESHLHLWRPSVGAGEAKPTSRLGLWRPRVAYAPTADHQAHLGLRRPKVGSRSALALALVGLLCDLATVGALLAPAPVAAADIRARCDGNTAVILARPAGTEHVQVICRDGIPEFMVDPGPIPVLDPAKAGRTAAIPHDWGGWVTVWLNSRPLKTPYDPARALVEPGAYLAKSTGRVMMPVRFFTEAFQGRVIWDATRREAVLYLQGKQVIIQADRPEATIAGRPVPLEQRPVIFQDRLFVPVRFLLESFNGKVNWDQANRSVRVELVDVTCGSPVYCGEVR